MTKVLRFTFSFWLLTFAFSCATKPEPLVAPSWDAIPVGVVDTFCLRLKAEGLAEGRVAVVNVTQPIASVKALAALAGPMPRKLDAARAAEALRGANRAIPLTLRQGECEWVAVDVQNAYKRADQMILEMSAPMANPFEKGQAGIFVRVSLAGEHGSWYWISLIPQGGGWVVGFIRAISD